MAIADKVPYSYLRARKKFPNVWCAGCGIGIVLGSLLRAIDGLGYKRDDIVLVSGIGCTARMPVYVDFNTLHTTHGRAIAFATGVKLARPRLKVIVVSGDGDTLAIGGNHFIHACRRNIDITSILVNNNIYGMTGGQFSPTTPHGKISYTSPYGNIEHTFNVAELAKASGASFVARGTTFHAAMLDKLIAQALEKKGFSLVEVLSQCPTYYGRLNRMGNSVKMIQAMKEQVLLITAFDKLPPEKTEGKLPIGVLHQTDRTEYCENYNQLIMRLQAESAEKGDPA